MIILDESLNDTDFTAAGDVAGVFGTPRRYESITIHHWGSFGQTHDGVVAFFMKPNSPTSAHFVASAGRIHCLVSPQDASWAAGNAYGNATSIHIEAKPEASEADYEAVAWLVRFLREHYGDLPLVPHRSWTATLCPGIWDLGRVDAMARSLDAPVRASATPPAPATPAPAPSAGKAPQRPSQCIVESGDTLSSIAAQFGVSLPELIAVNRIANPDSIFPGQVLNLPSERVTQCIVEAGDTLSGIALQFGRSLQQVLDANPGINPDLIHPGQVLNLG